MITQTRTDALRTLGPTDADALAEALRAAERAGEEIMTATIAGMALVRTGLRLGHTQSTSGHDGRAGHWVREEDVPLPVFGRRPPETT